MVITNNISALFAGRQLNIQTNNQESKIKRLSSGYRINSAADDAAGLSISEKLRAQIRGLNQGAQNLQDGISFCNVAEGALNEVHSILDRIKELSVAAADGTYTDADREAVDSEMAELKQEINRISRTTEYNTMRIFDEGAYKVEFSGRIGGIQIFDVEDYDDNNVPYTSDDSRCYGGIIVNKTRVKWDAIDPTMVYKDSDGKQYFREGSYKYSQDGINLIIICKDGDQPPQIDVEYEITASGAGINIGAVRVDWEDLYNGDGERFLDHIGEGGYYSFRKGEGEGGFFIEEGAGIGDIVKGIAERNKKSRKHYISSYAGALRKQAVDVTAQNTSKIGLDQALAISQRNEPAFDTKVTVRADKDGIWLEDDLAVGKKINASFKTWEQLGIRSWDSLNDIGGKTYNYAYNSGNGKYDIKFSFTLLDETSKDSVIAGIDGMKLTGSRPTNGNTTTIMESVQLKNSVIRRYLDTNYTKNTLTLWEEYDLGRNFNQSNTVFKTSNIQYNEATDKFTLAFAPTIAGAQGLTYTGIMTSIGSFRGRIPSNALYEQYYKTQLMRKFLQDPNDQNKTLDQVVGSANITQGRSMSEKITLDDTRMQFDKKDPLMTNGSEYIGAMIDFSDLGVTNTSTGTIDRQLMDLVGTSFDATCKTNNKHYSISFVYGGTGTNGYSVITDGTNKLLQVDLKSMQEKIEAQKAADSDKTVKGTDFTTALLEVIQTAGFGKDNNISYIVEAAKLYVVDNRAGTDQQAATTFGVNPYFNKDVNVNVEIALKDTKGRTITPVYIYKITEELYEGVWAQDNNGDFIKEQDPTDSTKFTYKLYDKKDYYDENTGQLKNSNNDPTSRRCTLGVKLKDDLSTVYNNVRAALTAGDNGKISLRSGSYYTFQASTNENTNAAYVSTFNFKVIEDEDGFWIQSGSNQGQGVSMVWDGFSSYSLGLSRLSLKTQEEAQTVIRRVDHAIQKVSAIRGAFGAYSNIMERIYTENTNTAENLQRAESLIRDTDMAEELVSYSTANILSQATESVLAQANTPAENALKLLQ